MVAPDVSFDISAVHAAGDEAVVVTSVAIRLSTAAKVAYDGVFLYSVRPDGRAVSLRASWDLGAA